MTTLTVSGRPSSRVHSARASLASQASRPAIRAAGGPVDVLERNLDGIESASTELLETLA